MFGSSVQVLVRGLSSTGCVSVQRHCSAAAVGPSQWSSHRRTRTSGCRSTSLLSRQSISTNTGTTQVRHDASSTKTTTTPTKMARPINPILAINQSNVNTTMRDVTRSMTHQSKSLHISSPVVSASTPSPISAGHGRIVISRIMEAKDAQMFSTIHGGTMMNLMEEAGAVFSAEYVQSFTPGGADAVTTVSACLEKAEFLQPVFAGQLVEVHAEIGYASQNSMQILISVYARTDEESERRLTNRSKIWYVPLSKADPTKVLPVPPFTDYSSPEIQTRGLASYEAMKKTRKDLIQKHPTGPLPTWFGIPQNEHRLEPWTVDFSRATMVKGIHPSSCWPGESYCRGGVVMKMIDEVGCLSAVQHCTYYCLTVGVESTFFYNKVLLGHALVAYSRVIFCSSKTVELKVDVYYQVPLLGKGMLRVQAAESILTCVSVDSDFQPVKMPPLVLKTDEERELFDERKRVYDERKASRKSAVDQ